MKKVGTVHPKRALFLREAVGQAEAGKLKYDMSSLIGSRLPMITSLKTGKTFTLSWENIIDLARAAGIDK